MKGKIFIGGPATGKSRSIKLMTRGEKVYRLNGRSLLSIKRENLWDWFTMHACNLWRDETLLYIDDVPASKLVDIIQLLFHDKITVHRKNMESITISPKVIIASDAGFERIENDLSILRRFKVYTCIGSIDHGIIMKLHHPKQLDKVYTKTPDND